MTEVQIAQLLVSIGALFIVAFGVLNFGVERVWFPRPQHTAGNRPSSVPPPARRAHMTLGTLEGICFIIGIILITAGCAIVGTRGYGSF